MTPSFATTTASKPPIHKVSHFSAKNEPPPLQKKRLIDFIHQTIATLHYSSYRLGGTQFDRSHGVYILDCSSYVNHILKSVYPYAYTSLVHSSGSPSPNSQDYYHFFTALPKQPHHRWSKITDVSELRPGDILVFRFRESFEDQMQGHVMVVMKKPERHHNNFVVRVSDSAPVGHSQDTRKRHRSGIGIGNLFLRVNSKTGSPSAYAWNARSHWKNHVVFAMARPIDIY